MGCGMVLVDDHPLIAYFFQSKRQAAFRFFPFGKFDQRRAKCHGITHMDVHLFQLKRVFSTFAVLKKQFPGFFVLRQPFGLQWIWHVKH